MTKQKDNNARPMKLLKLTAKRVRGVVVRTGTRAGFKVEIEGKTGRRRHG